MLVLTVSLVSALVSADQRGVLSGDGDEQPRGLDFVERTMGREVLEGQLDRMAREHIVPLGLPAADRRLWKSVEVPTETVPSSQSRGVAKLGEGEVSGPSGAELSAAKPEAQQEHDYDMAMLMKPPGCRPRTQEQMNAYTQFRTLCATMRPSPAANPTSSTKVTMKIANLQLVEINARKQTFTMEVLREVSWFDSAATKNLPNNLWQAQKYIVFTDAVLTQALAPADIYVKPDGEILVKEFLRVTFSSSWDYSFFPFESHELRVSLQTTELTDQLEPLTLRFDSTAFSNRMSGWSATGEMQASYSEPDRSYGPSGVWGKSQQIVLSIKLNRGTAYGVVKVVFPTVLCALLSYAGFFVGVTELSSRLLLPILAGVGLINFMFALSDETPSRSYMTLSEWFTLCQLLLMGGSIVAHMKAESFKYTRGFQSSQNIDRTFRFLYVPMILMTCVISGLFSFWQNDRKMVFLLLGIGFTALTIVVPIPIFYALEATGENKHSKLDDAVSLQL